MKNRMIHCSIAIVIFLILTARWLMPNPREMVYLLKPLVILLMIGLTLSSTGSIPRYRTLIAAGLLCSLVGDVFLMLPANLFLPGLTAFFCAHIFFLTAFTIKCGIMQNKSLLLMLLPAALIMPLFWPGVPSDLRVPVILYLLIITAMTMQAAGRALLLRNKSGWLAMFGALLFFCSDALLAINRFGVKLPESGLWVLGAYYPAQWLIASSVQYFFNDK